jgi:hypothetical protein
LIAATAKWMLSAITGAAAGWAAAMLVARQQVAVVHPATSPWNAEPGNPEAPAPREQARAAAGIIAAMSAITRSAPPATPVSDPPEPHPTDKDRTEQLGRETDVHTRRIADHRLEARDIEWAHNMEGSISDAIRGYRGTPLGQYERVDCRTTTCVVTFSWASREEGQSELQTTLERIGPVPCATEFTLPPEDSADGPRYEASVYLDCQGARSPGSAGYH